MAVVVLKPKFTKEQIKELVAVRIERIRQAILLILQKIGEEFIINVRNNNTYKDRTGNLRSSTGYVILYNGQQIFGSDFEPVIGPEASDTTKKRKNKADKFLGDFKGSKTLEILNATEKKSDDGAKNGKDLIDEISARFPTGFVIIGVAGMDYAAAVEAKGFDVITFGSIAAATDLKTAMDKLKSKLV